MIKVNGLSVSRIPINGKETLRVMRNGQQLWSGTGLPAGYTLLEYIESNGNSYIDTGFKPNPYTTKMDISFSLNSTSSTLGIFGSRPVSTAASKDSCNVFVINNAIRLDWVGSSDISVLCDTYTLYNLSCHKNKVTVNGIEYTSNINKGENYLLYPVYIGTFNNAGSPYSGFLGKIYSCKIYDDGVLVRDYIPCKNQSGVYGLYDKVNEKFYGSASGAVFTGA